MEEKQRKIVSFYIFRDLCHLDDGIVIGYNYL